MFRITASDPPTRPFDVAVVLPTVLRPTLGRAVRSVFAQQFSGTIQILIGIDSKKGDEGILSELAQSAPTGCSVAVFDPGYSTSARHGGFCPAATGGALRTILSYTAHSRLVAYLDDDNWWGPDHIASLAQSITGNDWAYSLRWFVDAETEEPLCVDTWESVGPNAGVFEEHFGGFVDPSCLMIDKVTCEPGLRLWCQPIPGDVTGMSTDRPVFAYLRSQRRGVGTGKATSFYVLNPTDPNHSNRLQIISGIRFTGGAACTGS